MSASGVNPSALYVVKAPAPSGDVTGAKDQAALQALLTTAAAVVANGLAGTAEVRLQSGLYWVTGLVIGSGVRLIGQGLASTTVKLATGANQHVIRSNDFENRVPATLTTAIPAGSVGVVSLAVTALTKAVATNDTIQVLGGVQSFTASAPAGIGATAIAVNSVTNGGSVLPVGSGVLLNPSTDITLGCPYGIQILELLIDGNWAGAHNAAGRGIAIFGIRTKVDGVLIFNAAQEGFFHTASSGTTGSYPQGQIETHIGELYIAQCGGTGFHYEGPHDGFCDWLIVRSCTGNGAEIGQLDGNYLHSYGNAQGVVMQHVCRWAHIESENSTKENFVNLNGHTISSSVTRLTAFEGWTSGGVAGTNFGVIFPSGSIDIADVLVTQQANAVGAISVTGDHVKIGGGKAIGQSNAGTIGLSTSTNLSQISVDVQLFPTAWARVFSDSSQFAVSATNCPTGLTDSDTVGQGNTIDFNYKSTNNADVPWTLPASPTGNYRLVSKGNVPATYELTASGLDMRAVLKVTAREILTGESCLPMELCGGSTALTSQQIRFGFFTASKTESVNFLRGTTSAVGAGATPTLCRMGLWSVDASGNLTLVAACTSDTTLFAAANTAYTRANTFGAYTKKAGTRYAWGYLVVTAAALPTMPTANFNGPGSETLLLPMQSARVDAQADLPASVAVGSLLASTQRMYMAITP